MALRSLIYVSSANRLLSTEELWSLLEVSRRNNLRAGVTGMLLYKGGNFMQVIEGEAAQVDALHARILRDKRHHGVFTLLDRTLEGREFPVWSMGFQNFSDPASLPLPGWNRFLASPWAEHPELVNPSRALKLLRVFGQRNR